MHFREATDALNLTFDQETVFLQLRFKTYLGSGFILLSSLLLVIELLLIVHIVPISLVGGAALPEKGVLFLYLRICSTSTSIGNYCSPAELH